MSTTIELSSMTVGEPSPQLPHQPRRAAAAAATAAAAAVTGRSRSSNNNNRHLNNNNNEETKINVRNLFAAATAGAPRPVTPIGPRGSSNSPQRREQLHQQQQLHHHQDHRTVRVLSPDILLDVGKSRVGSNNASVFTNSMNLTVPGAGRDADRGGTTPNGDVLSAETAGGRGGGGDGESSRRSKRERVISAVKSNFCSTYLKKWLWGVVMTVLVTASWTGTTQLLKSTFTGAVTEFIRNVTDIDLRGGGGGGGAGGGGGGGGVATAEAEGNLVTMGAEEEGNQTESTEKVEYSAPFFTTWFCSMGTMLFLPLYLVCQACSWRRRRGGVSDEEERGGGDGDEGGAGLGGTLRDAIQGMRDKGLSLGRFLGRCCLFTMLWVLTNYLYVHSLRILGPTEVVALFATNVSFIYLLSWVVLHEQFVGLRIVAVILCNTGIALLAYMDGINQTPTLGGVVLGAAASAGSAVYKVLFKRMMGEVSFCQVAVFFSLIGLCSTIMFWPIAFVLVLSGAETIPWGEDLPWFSLVGSLLLSLVANLLANFGIVVTYEAFITLGLILAVPASAVVDTYLYSSSFVGMRLAGLILISCGFVVVLLPSNWPDAIHTVIRWGRRRNLRGEKAEGAKRATPDLRTGHIGSRLRSPSGRVK